MRSSVRTLGSDIPLRLSARFLKWADAMQPIGPAWKAISAEPLFDPSADEPRVHEAAADGDPAIPLKLYVRQIGDGRLLTPRRGARARPPQGRGRRGGQAPADRVEPPARDVDHPQLHAGRGAAARPHPGGQPRPHPRGREVRLHARLQAFDLRDLVDPPGDLPRAGRAGPDDPPAGARRRSGAPRHAGAPDRSGRSSTATRRVDEIAQESGFTPAKVEELLELVQDTSRSTRRSATARA